MTTSGSGGGSRGCLAEWEREWGYGRLSLRKITCLAQKFCLFIILTSSRHELRFLQFFFNFPPHVAAFFSEEFVHSQTKCEARHKTSSGAPAPWAHMLPTRRQRLRRPVNRNQELGAGTWQLGARSRSGEAGGNYTLHFNHNSNQRNHRLHSEQQASLLGNPFRAAPTCLRMFPSGSAREGD